MPGGERQPKVLVKVRNMEKIVCERRMDEGLRTFKDGAVGTIRTICAGGTKEWLKILSWIMSIELENLLQKNVGVWWGSQMMLLKKLSHPE